VGAGGAPVACGARAVRAFHRGASACRGAQIARPMRFGS